MTSLLTRKAFIQYAVLPGLRPRIQTLFMSGFQMVAFFIAMVFQAARLLPPAHPYTRIDNIGLFGIRHVVAAAANNLVISVRTIDQIILFLTILAGLVLMIVQLSLLAVSFLLQPVMAAMPTGFSGFFLTPADTRQQDLAYIFMDMVFGVPGMFESCVAERTGCRDVAGNAVVGRAGEWILADLGFPFPIHEALHKLFSFYSIGMLSVAAIITCYFIATILMETMQTGTAFGKRFNKVWAPVRIVVAFGLLVPIGYGLNSAQYVVLYAAKFGSGFATNGWNLFNETLNDIDNTSTYLGGSQALVSQPNVPEIGGLLQFLYVARTCAALFDLYDSRHGPGRAVEAYMVRSPKAVPSYAPVRDTSYQEMIDFIQGGDRVTVRFGFLDESRQSETEEWQSGFKGGIRPVCGEMVIPLIDPRNPENDSGSASGRPGPDPGPRIMQEYYWYMIGEVWDTIFGNNYNDISDIYAPLDSYNENFPLNTARRFTSWNPAPDAELPPPEYKRNVQQFYSRDLEAAMLDPGSTGLDTVIGRQGAIVAQRQTARWQEGQTHLREKGWAAAGIWYNRVAELNGSMTAAVLNLPRIKKYPEVMEYVYLKKKQQDQNISMSRRFEPVLANKEDVFPQNPEDRQLAHAMWQAFDYWQQGGFTSTSHTSTEKNFLADTIKALFGTEGLYSIRKNREVHPLAQLVGVGRALIESAVLQVGMAAVAGGGGGLFSALLENSAVGTFGSGGVTLAMTVATTCMTMGFILYYIVPFLPFIYFFFAIGGWIKAIFEAMVGVPLWALAHIRIDGEGLPGQSAMQGYLLILEIFLRPIMIIFGLLASIAIFAAMVAVLNDIWDLVASNMAGFDMRMELAGTDASQIAAKRSPIDQFFFTIVYTILVYLMAMSSFKLIDLIPNNIMRWLGQSVKSFHDEKENAAQTLVGTSYVGGQEAISAVGGGIQTTLQTVSKKGAGFGSSIRVGSPPDAKPE